LKDQLAVPGSFICGKPTFEVEYQAEGSDEWVTSEWIKILPDADVDGKMAFCDGTLFEG
jgi:hypothetical protein